MNGIHGKLYVLWANVWGGQNRMIFHLWWSIEHIECWIYFQLHIKPFFSCPSSSMPTLLIYYTLTLTVLKFRALKPKSNHTNHTKPWCFTILTIFSEVWPNFRILTKYQNFNKISEFPPNFRISTKLHNFDQYFICCVILLFLFVIVIHLKMLLSVFFAFVIVAGQFNQPSPTLSWQLDSFARHTVQPFKNIYIDIFYFKITELQS